MQIDPKIAIYLNIAYAILTGLSAPALQAAGIADASQVVAIAALVAMPLNIILHGVSSSLPGPLAPAAAAKALVLFAIIAGLGMIGGQSAARAATMKVAQENGGVAGALINSVTGQTPGATNMSGAPTPSLTGNPVQDIANAVGVAANGTDANLTAIEKAVTADTVADFTAAQAAYAALNDTTGAACNQSILSTLVALQTAANAKGLPKVHLAFDFAIARAIVLAAQPGSPIYNSCSPVADQVKQSVLQLVTGMITGATTVLPTLGLP